MDDRIVVRSPTPVFASVQLGALVTILLWVFHGWAVGVPALLISLLAVWRAFQTGFVLDSEGLHQRPFLPFMAPPVIPWAQLRSLDVDVVVVGTESKTRRTRLRFMVDGERQPLQFTYARERSVPAVLELVSARGVPVTDQRALSQG